VLLGFVAAELRNYIGGVYWGLPYPANTYLFFPGVRFTDFTAVVEGCSGLNPYFIANPSGQFPFLNFVAYSFSFFPMDWALGMYFSLVVFPFFGLCLIVFRGFNTQYLQNSLILTFLNYPMLFTLDRGNFEGLLFTCLLAFVYFFWRGKFWPSATALALAIALKGFPLVFLPIFLLRKRYAEMVFSFLLGGLLTVLSLASFEGGFVKNLEFLLAGSNFAHPAIQIFLTPPDTAQRGVSLFSLFKIAALYLAEGVNIDFQEALKVYRALAALAFLPMLWLAYRVRHEFWKVIGVLTIAALLLPHLSGHYKLIHMLFIILLFVVKERESVFDWAYALCLGLLMIPKPYFFLEAFRSDAPGRDLSIALVMDPLLLIALLVLFCIEKPLRIGTS
jgi:hypothetical protein